MMSRRLAFVGIVATSLPVLFLWIFYSQSESLTSPYSSMVQHRSRQQVLVSGRLQQFAQAIFTESNFTGHNETLRFSSQTNDNRTSSLQQTLIQNVNNSVNVENVTPPPPPPPLPLYVRVHMRKNYVRYELTRGATVTTYNFPLDHVNFSKRHRLYNTYATALRGQMQGQHSKRDRIIILAVVDLGYLEMAINLYVSSLLRHRFANYLFVCSESTACEILNALDISAFSYVDYGVIGKTASSYFSDQFKKKTHVKTMAILDALKLNYTVLITDVDIVFLKKPFDYMQCQSCDIQITSDESEGNSGFYLARNTAPAKKLHAKAMEMHEAHPELSNQKTLDRTMESMSASNELKYITLKASEFQNGFLYYEEGHRMWATDFPCESCVIVHNNWIVSNEAKIYRFREHHQWFVDRNDYYSSTERKYITYENPAKTAVSAQLEYEALKSAFWIAHILNRTLILPQFHKPIDCSYTVCNGHHFATCNLFYHMPTLDSYFGGMYRESSFLTNAQVPQQLLQGSQVRSVVIESDFVKNTAELDSSTATYVFQPTSASRGASLDEMKEWMERFSSRRVIHFRSLYGAVNLAAAAYADADFGERLEKGIRVSDYRQYFNKPVTFDWLPAKTMSGSMLLLIVVPVFVIPCLCLAVCYRTGACNMEEMEEYERRMRTIRKYRKTLKR